MNDLESEIEELRRQVGERLEDMARLASRLTEQVAREQELTSTKLELKCMENKARLQEARAEAAEERVAKLGLFNRLMSETLARLEKKETP